MAHINGILNMINNLVYKIDKNTNDISNIMSKISLLENKLSIDNKVEKKQEETNNDQYVKEIDNIKKKLTSIESSITTKDRIQLMESTIIMKTEDMVKKQIKDKITSERSIIIEEVQKSLSEPYDNISISSEVKNQIDTYFEYFEDKLMKRVMEYIDKEDSDSISIAQTDIMKSTNKGFKNKKMKKSSLAIDI